MTRIRLLSEVCVIAMLLFTGLALSSENRVLVNMMIDCDLYPYATGSGILEHFNVTEDKNAVNAKGLTLEKKMAIEYDSLLFDILNKVDPKKLNISIYWTGDYLSKKVGNYSYGQLATYLSSSPNHEMALHGSMTNESLAKMSKQEQDTRILNSKIAVEDKHICGGEVKPVKGFRPQSFSQNDDTYSILDHRNFTYDAGYQAGLIYLPGHENDTEPYKVDNHTFYAVPVSTHIYKGKLVPMWDRFALENGINGSQWSKLLNDTYSDCAKNGNPMVIIFTNFVIGSKPEYLDAYRKFMDLCAHENTTFVTTEQLVEMSKHSSRVSLKKNP